MPSISAATKRKMDMMVITMVIDAGLAYSIVENPSVQALFRLTCPAYKLPSRWCVTSLGCIRHKHAHTHVHTHTHTHTQGF